MKDLFFERRAPAPWRFLHPGVWSLLLVLVPGLVIGVVAGSGGFDWLEKTLVGVPESAWVGTIAAAMFLPTVAAAVLPLLWRKRYGSCHLRGDLLTFEPGGISIPRDEIKSWRRHARGLSLDSTLHPDNVLLRPLLIPVESEEELVRALRWLEGTQSEPEPEPAPKEPGAETEAGPPGSAEPATSEPQSEAPKTEPLVKLEARDQVFSVLMLLLLVVTLPVIGGLRFGWEAVSPSFGVGGILSSVTSGIIYSPGQERARFAYFASEGVTGGIAGYEVTVPGLLGDLAYGMRLGSGSRQVNVAEGRIQDGAYQRALDPESRAALRFGNGDWRTTNEVLPASLVPLVLKLDAEGRLESLPAALEPLLEDPSCPELVREFVSGRTSWRVHEAADASGERLVAVVLQGRIRTLALLPPGQPYGVEFGVLSGKSIDFRALNHGLEGRTPGLPVLSKKEDSQVCWIGAQGWSKAPIGNLNLEELLEALESLRAQRASAREALRQLLGATYPAGLDSAPR